LAAARLLLVVAGVEPTARLLTPLHIASGFVGGALLVWVEALVQRAAARVVQSSGRMAPVVVRYVVASLAVCALAPVVVVGLPLRAVALWVPSDAGFASAGLLLTAYGSVVYGALAAGRAQPWSPLAGIVVKTATAAVLVLGPIVVASS
jgi:hypothetical protein